VLPNEKSAEIQGPFALVNYLRPAVVLALPSFVFVAGICFAIGAWTRKPILVFVLPVALLLVCGFFLWEWSPSWLDPRINSLLMLVDPSGFRWLDETWLKGDRGVDFYNHASIDFDRPFLAMRLALVLAGFAAVAISQVHFAATLRGSRAVPRGRVNCQPRSPLRLLSLRWPP
jgi:hypothetical protein